MFLCLIFILCIIGYCFILSRSSRNHPEKYIPPANFNYYDEDDLDDFDDFDDEFPEDFEENHSSFAYPDPYEMEPRDLIYLDEEGEIREDL